MTTKPYTPKAGEADIGAPLAWLDDQPFYEAMQGYRCAPFFEQREVIAHFENVKRLIRERSAIDAVKQFRITAERDKAVAERNAMRALTPHWMPLIEGLPPEGEPVLISYFEYEDPSKDRIVCAAFRHEARWFYSWDTDMDGAQTPHEPTHWMALPSGPTLSAPAVEG